MMRCDIKNLLLKAVLTFGAASVWAAGVQGQQITLSEAIQMALQQNETVLIAEQGVARAKGQITSAGAEGYPKLSLNGFYTRNWRVPTSVINGNTIKFGSANVLNANLSLSIPLYKGGKVRAARRAAQAFREFSEANLSVARQQIAFDTQRAFYTVLLSDELVRVNEAALKQAEAHLEQVNQLLKAGTASDYEALRAKVQVANLKPAAITARNNRDIALLDLKRIIGRDLAAPLVISGSLDAAVAEELPVARTIDEAVSMALKGRPELIALDYQIELQEDNVRIQAGDGRPSVNLVNAYQNQAQVNDIGALATNKFVQSYNSRLVVDFPLFDGFKTRGGVAQARSDFRSATYSKQQRHKQVELEARQSFLRVEEALNRLDAQKETVTLADRGLQIAEVRYRTGVATQLEVFDAQVVLTQAQTTHAQALNDYAVAVASLRKALGVIK